MKTTKELHGKRIKRDKENLLILPEGIKGNLPFLNIIDLDQTEESDYIIKKVNNKNDGY